jgi:hypothetical protein
MRKFGFRPNFSYFLSILARLQIAQCHTSRIGIRFSSASFLHPASLPAVDATKNSKNAATITVNWGDENHSITLTPRSWSAVKDGRRHSQRGAGYHYEGEFFWDYWSFEGGLKGELRVGYGDDGGEGFTGHLCDAKIEEHEHKPRRRGL